MNRRSNIFPFFIEFVAAILVISFLTVSLSGQIPLLSGKPWPGIICGALFMLLATPFHLLGKKQACFYLVSCLMNAIGSGLFTSSYFTYDGRILSMVDLGLPFLIVIILMLIRCLTISLSQTGIILSKLLLVVNVLGAVASLFFWYVEGGVFYPMLYFLLVPEFMQGLFLLLYIKVLQRQKPSSPLRNMSFASYGYALIIGLVVLVILTEGDILDGVFDVSELRKGKKGNP